MAFRGGVQRGARVALGELEETAPSRGGGFARRLVHGVVVAFVVILVGAVAPRADEVAGGFATEELEVGDQRLDRRRGDGVRVGDLHLCEVGAEPQEAAHAGVRVGVGGPVCLGAVHDGAAGGALDRAVALLLGARGAAVDAEAQVGVRVERRQHGLGGRAWARGLHAGDARERRGGEGPIVRVGHGRRRLSREGRAAGSRSVTASTPADDGFQSAHKKLVRAIRHRTARCSPILELPKSAHLLGSTRTGFGALARVAPQRAARRVGRQLASSTNTPPRARPPRVDTRRPSPLRIVRLVEKTRLSFPDQSLPRPSVPSSHTFPSFASTMGRAVDMDSGKHGTVREMNALLDQLARQTEFVDVEDRSAPTKASLCARALVAGCPDAFINFHYLTTTGDGVGDDNPTEEELLARLVDPASYEEKEEVSAEHMPFVLESLVAAETHARSGDPAKTRDAYRALARFFIDTDNPMKAIFFHQKCLDAAVASGRAEDEMESNRALGETLESARNLADAVAAYERRLDAATRAEQMGTATADDIADARACLSRAYYAAAEWRGSEGDADGSVAFLERCLAVSEAERRDGDARAWAWAWTRPRPRRRVINSGSRATPLGITRARRSCRGRTCARARLGVTTRARAPRDARWPRRFSPRGFRRRRGGASKVRGRVRGERRGRRGAREGVLRAGEDSRRRGGTRGRGEMVRTVLRTRREMRRRAVERRREGKSGRRQGLARADGLMRHVAESADAPTPELLKWRSSRENFGYAV